MSVIIDEESPGRPFFPAEDRYKDDAGNFLRVAQLKRAVIHILMEISNHRANYRLAKLLQLWSKKYNAKLKTGINMGKVVPILNGTKELNDEIRPPTISKGGFPPSSSLENIEDDRLHRLQNEIFIEFESMFNAGPDSSDAVLLDLGILTGQPIGSILMDCMMYSSDDLFEAAFALLDRRFGQRRKLLSALSEVYLIDSQELPVFHTANNLMGKAGFLLYTMRSTQEWVRKLLSEPNISI